MIIFIKKIIIKNSRGQSAVELAIFGSILIFVISLIFRQGLGASNFMNTQLKATRYAMSKSLESSEVEKPGRNSGATLVIEDRLSGDFGSKFGSRDRVPLIASGSGSYSSQMFYPTDKDDYGDTAVLPHYDVWINGQRISLLTSNFKTVTFPTEQGILSLCDQPHPNDSRCWSPDCISPGVGCVVLHKIVENSPSNGFDPSGNFDINFDGTLPTVSTAVADADSFGFMWQWKQVPAVGELEKGLLDVDGDFKEENVLHSTVDADGRTATAMVIDRQDGDIDFTIDGRQPNTTVGLSNASQMYSFTRAGTMYRVQEGKLFDVRTDQYIRNTNMNDHVDIAQRVFKLSNDTGRFCAGNTPTAEGTANSIEACNNCFSATNVSKTCFDVGSLQIFVRSRIANRAGRSWFTRTEVAP